MLSEADIQRIADTIVERFQPQKIVLFGSYANGTATEDSDIDLLVVRAGRDSDCGRPAAIRKALLDYPCGASREDIPATPRSRLPRMRTEL